MPLSGRGSFPERIKFSRYRCNCLPGVEALKAGKLFGTVEADKEGYANAIFGIAASLSRGLPIDESIKLENGKYFWCSQKGLTQADIAGTDNK